MYIADDSKTRTRNFKNSLHKRLDSVDDFPYKFRKSIHFDNDDIGDYIFIGYTILYLVDEEKVVIVVLDIFKWIEK